MKRESNYLIERLRNLEGYYIRNAIFCAAHRMEKAAHYAQRAIICGHLIRIRQNPLSPVVFTDSLKQDFSYFASINHRHKYTQNAL